MGQTWIITFSELYDFMSGALAKRKKKCLISLTLREAGSENEDPSEPDSGAKEIE